MAYDPNSTLPATQEGILLAILETLGNILSRTADKDPTTGRTRVLVESNAALPANQSVNVAQINSVTPLMGVGASGTGSHRVTPASDTIAGMTSVYMMQQAAYNVALMPLYNRIT
jgi:hypothetical protein